MLKFFGTTKIKPREFNYQPRYYDADQEELERRKKGRLSNDKGEMTKSRLRREFGNYKASDVKHTKTSFWGSSSFRLLLIIVALSVISYYVLENFLPQLMEHWFPEENADYDMLEEWGQ